MEIKANVLNRSDQEKYDRARKKVNAIKGFYKHLSAYIIVNLGLLLLKANALSALADQDIDLNFERWLYWNFWGTAFFWGIAILIHGLYVYRYKFKFLNNWEKREIRKIIEKEENEQRNKFE